jgi:hypothetical protein
VSQAATIVPSTTTGAAGVPVCATISVASPEPRSMPVRPFAVATTTRSASGPVCCSNAAAPRPGVMGDPSPSIQYVSSAGSDITQWSPTSTIDRPVVADGASATETGSLNVRATGS